MNQSQAHNPARPPFRQLPLPFSDPDPAPSPLPTPVAFLSSQQIWATLPLAMQMGVRTTLVRVFQEVFNDRSCS
jgi:hypothetical protein